MDQILLVENDLYFAQDVMKYFEQNKIPYRFETDGLHALNAVHEKLPAVVIADKELPNIDGLSLSKFIKLDEKFSKIKFLLLISSSADELSLEAGLDIDAIIEKPISPKELVERLISVLQGDDN